MATGKSRAALVARVGLEGGDEFLRDLKELGVIGERAFKDIEKAAADVKSLGPLARRVKELRREMDAASKQFTKIGNNLRQVGTRMSAAITAPLLAIGAASLKGFADFEKGMANVSTLIDTSTESMREMETAVLDISKRVPVTIGDLTAALYDVRSAGIDASQAMTVLEQSARLGVAGLGSTASAVNLVTSAINAFGLEGREQAEVYDLIFTAVKNGKTTIDQLSQGFGSVAGTVSEAGIELDEFLASVAALTTTGLPASEAYTQLRAVIAGLTRDTAETADVFEKLGVKSFKELIQSAGGLVPALEKVRRAVDGNDAVIVKLFGSMQAYNAVVGLTGKQNAAFVATLDDMRDGISNVDEAFEKQRQTVDAAFTAILNSVERARIAIGRDLVPTFLEVRDAIEGVLDGFTSLEPETRKTAILIAGIAAAAGPLVLTLGFLAIAIGALLTPVGLIVLGVTALAGALVAAYVASEDVRVAINGLAGAIATAAQGLLHLGDRLTNWILGNETGGTAADQHREAVEKLQSVLKDVEKGLPGAAQKFLLLAESQRKAALAALAHARANLEFIRQQPQFAKIVFLYEEALAEAEKSLDDLDVIIRQGFDQINGIDLPTAPIKAVGDAAKAAADAVGDVGDAADNVADDVDKVTKAVGRLKAAVTDPSLTQASIIEPGKIVTSIEKVEAVRQNIAGLLAEMRNVEKGGDDAAAALDDVGDADIGGAVDDLRRLNDAIELIASEAEAMQSRFKAAFDAIGESGTAEFEAVAAAGEAAAQRIKDAFSDLSTDTFTGAAGDIDLEGSAGEDRLGGDGPFAGMLAAVEELKASLATLDFATVRDAGVAAFAAIEEKARTALAAIQAGIAGLGGAAAAAGGEAGGAGEEEAAAPAGGFSGLVTAADAAWTAVRAGAQQLAADILAAFQAIIEQISDAFAALADTITGVFDAAKAHIDDIAAQIRAVVESLIAEMKRLEAAAKAALAAVNSARSASGGSAPGLARGGYLASGPGTSTSDSIWARLSRGEYVISARAVAHFGPALFDQLNRLRVPQFNAGGIVDALGTLAPSPMPAISAAGLNAAMAGGNDEGRSRFTLMLPSGREVPVSARRSAVDEIERELVRSDYARATGPLPAQRRQR